ncbi:transglycosylase SLT domain-containing protein [Alicyclobacillus sp. TC]|uniref:transglycosylase SLT domain-containing protein n=1 Tax=Alicyclobacillus sp. TC TaxID=2606450 RepID=UPI001EE41090|nr:transglycosylase SLT domain-containing protein [Alicyclobacillus sp. TC]
MQGNPTRWMARLTPILGQAAQDGRVDPKALREAVKEVLIAELKAALKKKILSYLLSNAWWIIPLLFLLYYGLGITLALFSATTSVVTFVPWQQLAQTPAIENGIPAEFVTDVERASAAYRIPMQYLAAVAYHESGWNPAAYADYDGSHAMGLTQFEPGTWSGSGDPDQTVASPDTDATRILRYGGFGVDADGLMAPMGTPATAALNASALLALSQACSSGADCVPYASPFDPADALMAGAKYLSYLRDLTHGTWESASEAYYGLNATADAQYAADLVALMMAYTEDFIPPAQGHVFGSFPVTQSVGVVVVGTLTPKEAMWSHSVPLYAPVSGIVTRQIQGGRVILALPDGTGLTMPYADFLPFAFAKGEHTVNVQAGRLWGM